MFRYSKSNTQRHYLLVHYLASRILVTENSILLLRAVQPTVNETSSDAVLVTGGRVRKAPVATHHSPYVSSQTFFMSKYK
jgi:hypothetical protein